MSKNPPLITVIPNPDLSWLMISLGKRTGFFTFVATIEISNLSDMSKRLLQIKSENKALT